MAMEIERKFLVTGDDWRADAGPGVPIRQFYLALPGGVLRVRRAGPRAYLTLKGRVTGISRPEFEFEIPAGDADEMAACFAAAPHIAKTRHAVDFEGQTWTVDVFSGPHAGLVLAEIELEQEDQTITPPPWVGREVSHDPRYFNSEMARSGQVPKSSDS